MRRALPERRAGRRRIATQAHARTAGALPAGIAPSVFRPESSPRPANRSGVAGNLFRTRGERPPSLSPIHDRQTGPEYTTGPVPGHRRAIAASRPLLPKRKHRDARGNPAELRTVGSCAARPAADTRCHAVRRSPAARRQRNARLNRYLSCNGGNLTSGPLPGPVSGYRGMS